MPIYEFYSPETHKIYQFFSRKLSDSKQVPRCPDGTTGRLEKVISKFAFVGRAREKQPSQEGNPATGGEAELLDLARQMESLDSEHPDPRQLGGIMRRVAQATGEKMPEQFGEMIRRLELGETPEKLQDEFGDSWDEDLPSSHPINQKADSARKANNLLRRLRAPERDPKLYELSDYL